MFYRWGICCWAAAWFLGLPVAAQESAESLRKAVAGADRLELGTLYDEKEGRKPIVLTGELEIAKLIKSLDFVEDQPPFYSWCLPENVVTLYRGDKVLAKLGNIQGTILRWSNGKWKSDAYFTPESARAWREWFARKGVRRFQKMYDEQVARYQKEKAIHDKFMSAYPAGAPEIFESITDKGWVASTPRRWVGHENVGKLSERGEKLRALFADRESFATAIAKSLGGLSQMGASEGDWSSTTYREKFALECGRALSAGDFLKLGESKDDEVLLGAARLYFYEGMSRFVPEDKRSALADTLTRAVLRSDKCGNSIEAVMWLGESPGKETTALLEEMALGQVKSADPQRASDDEPLLPVAACLLLAQTDSPEFKACYQAASALPNQYKADKAALQVARALHGEKGLLDASIFKVRSYIVGYGAVDALEAEGDKRALDALVTGGTQHPWADVQEEAVFAIERMTGKQWYPGKGPLGPSSYGKEIREWWEKNHATFQFPAKVKSPD